MNIICHESPLFDSIYHISSKRYLHGKPFSFVGAPTIQEHIIINNRCAEFSFEIDGETFKHDGSLICGKFIHVPKITIRFTDMSKDLMLIRLNPYSLSRLSKHSPADFVDRVLALSLTDLPSAPCAAEHYVKTVDSLVQHHLPDEAYAKTERIVAYIKNHFSELPGNSVGSIAKQFEISESTLRRYFKKYLGISLSDFMLTIKRRKMVQSLFENNYDSLSVRENGYYDQSHFLNDFKRLYGFPLKQYMSRLRFIQNEDPELMRFLYNCNIRQE